MNTQVRENYGIPLVSVIMPAHNSEKYIRQSIQSVQNQTLKNWELLIIDDASRDDTVQIILGFSQNDPRIKLHINKTNKGTAWCRNYGMKISTGKTVAYLDSDDIWYPDKLERQLTLLEQKSADLVYCSYGYIDEDGMRSQSYFLVPETASLEKMLKQNVIGCSTVMLTKEIATQYYFSRQFYFEDFVFWLSLLQDGKQMYGITDVLVDYRIRKNSRSNNKLMCAKNRWHVFREFSGFSRMKSLYYMVQYAIAGIRKYLSI